VGEASAPDEALEFIRHHQPDVLLTDIRLKGSANGVTLARQVRSQYPEIKIVVLTNYSNEPYIRAMMEIGVEGYILKDTPPRDIIDSLRMVMAGQTVFSALVTQRVRRGYLGSSGEPNISRSESITERESEVLRLLANGSSNLEIAERLNLSEASVRFHLSNIYSKLGVRGRAEAIIQAAREGLVVIDE
jgi:DNA-binding NarL/FixJ family response regulator